MFFSELLGLQETHSPTLRWQSCSTTVSISLANSIQFLSLTHSKVSPPHILGYANGVAQSIVSFARFLGPVLGGYVSKLLVYANIETPFNFITHGIAMVR